MDTLTWPLFLTGLHKTCCLVNCDSHSHFFVRERGDYQVPAQKYTHERFGTEM
jgi:hypothetical protein